MKSAQVDSRVTQREILTTWAQAIGLLAVAKLASLLEPSGILAANLAGVAALVFILLPERRLERRGELWSSYGLPWWGWNDARTWRAWGRGLVVAAGICSLVFPLFFLVFEGYSRLLPSLPAGLSHLLAPYALPRNPHFRLPPSFGILVLNQLLVVALPEELFYRGWMQTSWNAASNGRRVRLLGASLGMGFLGTQLLFALGHLVVFQVWRLGTFFPGLLFGWLRERTGNLTAPVFVHAFSNLFLAILEASYYG